MVSKLGFFSGTSFLLSTSRALKWPAKTIVEKATMKKPMAAAAVWSRKHRTSLVLEPWSLSWVFFLAQAFCYLLHALWGPSCWDSTADAKSLSQALSLSLYFNRSYFMGTKMACKDDCWEDYYEEAKEQNGCRSSSLTIATKPKWCFRKPMNFMNLFSRLSELSWKLYSTREISPKSENK